MERKWTVYIHTNKINNKAYIGITSRDAEDRWGKNGNGYREDMQCVFSAAIKKYGWDNFEHIIFADNLTEIEAKHTEKLLIAIYKTNVRRWGKNAQGYNMTDGGDGSSGRKCTEETKRKISESKVGTQAGVKHPRATKVAQYTTDGDLVKVWDYIKQAADTLGISKADISRCCDGKHFTVGGFIWKKVDNDDAPVKIKVEKPTKGIAKPVLCVEVGAVYKSSAEAERQTGVCRANINKCCKNNKFTAGGYHWRYYEPELAVA